MKDSILALIHTPAKTVPLSRVEDELVEMMRDPLSAATAATVIPRACTLTLVVLCAAHKEPDALDPLISQVVGSNPGRMILIAQNQPGGAAGLETRVSLYHTPPEAGVRVLGEAIALYPRGEHYKLLPSVVLGLRVTGVPFVLLCRGQPDFDDRLFAGLVGECDQILFDSAQFTARAEQVNHVIARLRHKYAMVACGDLNWQRLLPWREFIAQFFDDPANLPYLDHITHLDIEFSVGQSGNQSQAVLLMGWLASVLDWRPLPGSYEREGMSRRARFRQGDREVVVNIRVREQPDCLPGQLTGVRIEAQGNPNAVLRIKRAVGGFVDIEDIKGSRVLDRCAALNIPQDSVVIASELDAPRRDRNYYRAVELIQQLVTGSG